MSPDNSTAPPKAISGERPETDFDALFAAVSEPFGLIEQWLDEARVSEPNDAEAMAMASVDKAGCPNVRMVLLKGIGPRGLVFYTNLESDKGNELAGRPEAALCLHWKSLRRQIRARGPVEPVDKAEADAYFATRARESRIGAWSSRQSRVLSSRAELVAAAARIAAQFEGADVPRPPHWSGFRVCAHEVEFWCDGPHRLHDRIRFTRAENSAQWTKTRLFP